MNIQSKDGGVLEVRGLSELVAANAAHVRDAVRGAITPAHRCLRIDLSGVTFLDSSGLGTLISLHKTLRTQNGSVQLINPSGSSLQILELTRLHRLFEVVNS